MPYQCLGVFFLVGGGHLVYSIRNACNVIAYKYSISVGVNENKHTRPLAVLILELRCSNNRAALSRSYPFLLVNCDQSRRN